MRAGAAEPRQPIVVAGSGRSGTTWISSVLAECQDAVPTFEPLNGRRVAGVPLTPGFPDCPGYYLPAARCHAAWQAFFRKLFDGDISCCWTRQDWKQTAGFAQHLPLSSRLCYYVARKRYEKRAALARSHIIKTIRANLLLGWLVRHFAARVIFVIRHPCAVVASRLHHRWSASLEGIRCQPTLIEDYLQPMRPYIDRADGDVERLAVLWCVENLVPLRLPRPARMTMHWYESFERSPQSEFARLFQTARLEPTVSAERAMRRFYSNSSAAVWRGQRDWHAGLGIRDGQRVLDICNAFGLRIYGPTCEPLEENVFQ